MKRLLIILSILLVVAAIAFAEEKPPEKVRKSAIAGSWYPADPAELEKMLTALFSRAPKVDFYGEVRALIVPHAGYQYSGPAAAYAYATIRGQDIKRVIIMAPTHTTYFYGVSIPRVRAYETPLGELPLDWEQVSKLLKMKPFSSHPEAHQQEHSVEIQLPLLKFVLSSKNFTIIPMVFGELNDKDYEKVAGAIAPLLDDNTLIIASSDFTHYGKRYRYTPFDKDIRENLRKLDSGAIEKIVSFDFPGFLKYKNDTGATICGFRPIAILLKLLGGNYYPEVLSYYMSADITGDLSESVSYASICFTKKRAKLLPGEKETLLNLSRDTLRLFLKEKRKPEITLEKYNITPKLLEQSGVFVTLKKEDRLRGCIGYIQGRFPIYQAVIANTINAATRDPRFPPMTSPEINEVEIEITVLTPLKKTSDISEIEVGKHGLYLVKGADAGLLLPQVATEFGWNRRQFLEAVSEKAGLDKDAWKIGAEIYIFEGQVFAEKKKH
jgi:AmmeMemoRadiSam system protein B/AmmeMemoRadiSam system protein A